jgi:hypothetical protein
MKDCPSRLRTGLSSLLTYTLIKYNHLRLYGQSLNLNLYGPNPRVMMTREHSTSFGHNPTAASLLMCIAMPLAPG